MEAKFIALMIMYTILVAGTGYWIATEFWGVIKKWI